MLLGVRVVGFLELGDGCSVRVEITLNFALEVGQCVALEEVGDESQLLLGRESEVARSVDVRDDGVVQIAGAVVLAGGVEALCEIVGDMSNAMFGGRSCMVLSAWMCRGFGVVSSQEQAEEA